MLPANARRDRAISAEGDPQAWPEVCGIPKPRRFNPMNRIQQYWTASADSRTSDSSEISSGRFTSTPDAARALFAPVHYESNYAYPLIVWLHGANDDERQLKRIMPFISLRNYVAISPRGTLAADDRSADRKGSDSIGPCAKAKSSDRGAEAGRTGFAWEQTEKHILLAESRVLEAVDHAQQTFNISPRRIFLAGFGCGGTMAFRIALNLPDVFAGALSLGGPFPLGFNPLAQLVRARSLKWLLSTGRESRRYPPDRVCENLRLLYAAGMSISLRQYPCGDDLTTQMLGDIDRWIMEQLTTPEMSNSGATPHAGGSVD
jgi:phospholipase/carboxylesterase